MAAFACGGCRKCGVCAIQNQIPTYEKFVNEERIVKYAKKRKELHDKKWGRRVLKGDENWENRVLNDSYMPPKPGGTGDPVRQCLYSTISYTDPYFLSRLAPVLVCNCIWLLLPVWEYVEFDYFCWRWENVKKQSENYDFCFEPSMNDGIPKVEKHLFNFFDYSPPKGIIITVKKQQNGDVKKALTLYKWSIAVDFRFEYYMGLAIRDWILDTDKNRDDKRVNYTPEREDVFVKFVRTRSQELNAVIPIQRKWRRISREKAQGCC